jgi:hypothetical protein
MKKTVDNRATESWGHNERIGTSQPRLVKIMGTAKPIGMHGNKLKNQPGQPSVDSTLTFGTTFC